jgi:ATP-binding cassette subfamily F protein 2
MAGKRTAGKKTGKGSSAPAAPEIKNVPNTYTSSLNADDAKVQDLLSNITVTASSSSASALTGGASRSRDIKVEALSVLFHGRELVKEATLALNYGRRYGLIGVNGCGKSTLMTAIGNRMIPVADYIDIFHLSHEMEASELTALEAVLSVDEEKKILEREAEKLSDLLMDENVANSDAADEINLQISEIYERLDKMESGAAEAKAAQILHGLGFTSAMQAQKTKDFSGGWRMRISLSRALFLEPTLLLLDEPTNHLDMEAVVWLEEYLKTFNKILLMVSHSQDFMNNVCTNIIHFTQKGLIYYTGNYDTYIKTKFEKDENQAKKYQWEQDQIKNMKEYIARFGHGSAKLARQAQSKEKVLAKMEREGLTDKVHKDKVLSFYFPDPDQLPPPVLQFQEVCFGYPGKKPLYKKLDLGIDLDSRIALVGPNGAGKTTLLKLMSGELTPTEGMVRPHNRLKIAKFTQHFVDVLSMDVSPLEYMQREFPGIPNEKMSAWLGRFGITGDVQFQRIEHLSDGQKSRLVFSWMAYQEPHILLLDEPTNHLDIETIDSLAQAINAFSGGVVLVSHDMRLISRMAEEIWMCDKGKVEPYKGTIEDYKKELRRDMNLE